MFLSNLRKNNQKIVPLGKNSMPILQVQLINFVRMPTGQMNSYRIWFISFLYSAIIVLFPWESIKLGGFPDLENYHGHLIASQQNLDNIISNAPSGADIIPIIISEPGWIFLCRHAYAMLGTSDLAVAFFQFSSSVLICRFLMSGPGGLFSLLFLFNPLVVDLLYSQLRIAVALALYLTAIARFGPLGWASLLAAAATLLIHTSMALLVPMVMFSTLVSQWRNSKIFFFSVFFAIIAISCMAYVMIFLRSDLLMEIGDRRAIYDADIPTWKFALPWSVVPLALLGSGRQLALSFSGPMSAGLICIFIAMTIAGEASLRFLSIGILFLPAAMVCMSTIPRVAFLLMYIPFTFIHALMWTGII